MPRDMVRTLAQARPLFSRRRTWGPRASDRSVLNRESTKKRFRSGRNHSLAPPGQHLEEVSSKIAAGHLPLLLNLASYSYSLRTGKPRLYSY